MLLTIAHGSPVAVANGIDARVVVFGTILCEVVLDCGTVFNWAFEEPARAAATAAKVTAARMMSSKSNAPEKTASR
jgi:hypothetical protein